MKIETSELSGAALDWAVAKCEGYIDDCNTWMHGATISEIEEGYYKPSTDWAQGGPIIEREAIAVSMGEDGDAWCAWFPLRQGIEDSIGATPLVAAMRCYVASKLGEEVDILEELIK